MQNRIDNEFVREPSKHRTEMYQPKTDPYDHQRDIMVSIHDRPSLGLFLEMGVGKTWIIVNEFGDAVDCDEIDDLLVIAPAGNYLNWPEELAMHMDPRVYRHVSVAVWESGKPNRSIMALLEEPGPRALIINIEALARVKAARDVCTRFLTRRAIVAIDESTKIKGFKSKRTMFILTLRQLAARRRILSGLPTPQSPLDLFSQMGFLDPRIIGMDNYYTFKARYAVMKKIYTGRLLSREAGDHVEYTRETTNVVTGYRALEHLQQRIAPYIIRLTKEQCLDLPPLVYDKRLVTMTPEQQRLYQEIRDNATARLAGGTYVNATRVITAMQKLQQMLCGFVVDENLNMKEVPTNRFDVLLELLEDFDGKAIIWAPHKKSIEMIAALLREVYGPETVAIYYGPNRSTRKADETEFKLNPKCRWMISTPSAGGLGNNWVMATLMVYFANSFNLEDRIQSESRAHRSGQKLSVTCVDLICPGTMDEKTVFALRNKLNLATIITGENYRSWLI